MVYAVPEQRALAWGGFGGCGFGCGGGFFGDSFGFPIHKTIIQTIHQVNNCSSGDEDHKGYDNNNQDHNNNNKQVVCVNTATNTARHGFGGFGGFG